MSTVLTIIYALIIFSVIIFVHELGHFVMAKAFKVYVIEFAIGMGPAIFKVKKGETTYAVRAIPMGGFCKMEGEDGENASSPRSFASKPKLQRFLILFAGSFMNLVLGLILTMIMLGSFVQQGFVTNRIDSLYENLPAYEAGLMEGDQIRRVNGHRVYNQNDFFFFDNYSRRDTTELEIKRGSSIFTVLVTPKTYLLSEDGIPIRESVEPGAKRLFGVKFKTEPKSIHTVIKNAGYEFVFLGKVIVLSLRDLISGQIDPSNLSGPVGIVGQINTAARAGLEQVIYLAALITINLGIFNLLPLPALDGGRIVFILVEAILRKPIPEKYEGWIHAAGFVLLILLMLYATGNDIIRMVKGG